MLQWLQVFGRFHILVLHLPIGLLAGLAGVELITLVRRRPPAREITGTLAWLAAGAAALAAAMGYVLSFEDGYGGDTLTVHLYLGIALAITCVLTALLHARESRAIFRAALLVALFLLVPTGHFGGVMTHGEDFLTAPLARSSSADPAASAATPAPSGEHALSFTATIGPIFEARCIACHGQGRVKGGLALHDASTIAVGGKNGPVISSTDPAASELLRRLHLPIESDRHMPPRGKPQLTAQELGAIEAWIAAGAPFDGSFTPTVAAAGTSAPHEHHAPTPTAPRAASGPSDPPTAAAIAAVRARLAHVEPVERGSNLLWVDVAAAATTITDDDVETLLVPLRDHVAELSLSRSAITDRTLPTLAAMPNLRRLELRGTAVTDAGVAALRSHPRLEELVLAQTHLTDAAVDPLAAMPALTRVNLWRSGVSAEAAIKLSANRGSLVVELGDRPVATPIQTEDSIKLTSDAPAPGAGTPAPPSLKPANTTCPVSGKAVDPDYVIIYRGRVIGFCCRHCAEQFWIEPAKFESALNK